METGSSNSKKILVAGTLAVLALFYGYYFFFRTSEVASTFDEFGNPVGFEVVGQDLIDLSLKLETITLDASALKKKTFTNLVDFSINLPADPQGRPNPFDPVGSRSNSPDPISAIIKSN